MSDLLIYAVHALFWASFGVTRMVVRPKAGPVAGAPEVTAEKPATAPFSRGLLALHTVAFGVMYLGIGQTVVPNRVPEWFAGQRIVGTAIIALGAFFMSWSLAYFQSWRFRAQLDAGHQLATGGPFRWVRHPIYLGLTLLALGSAVWVPTAFTWVGFVLMFIGSDLRGRAEEKLLEARFGEAYRAYTAKTKRFVPGVY